ncbi:MAG TPA: NAD(P)H-hydrate dehydratase [Terriglobales bacterium]|nr:NAD(P)H-hydrate dehydratase [Terriglobales bacterium]
MHLLSAAQMRECDAVTIAGAGPSGSELMAAAAAAVVARIERDFPAALSGHITILCGGGNNGGDGLVMARILGERAVAVSAIVLAREERLTGDALRALVALRALGGSEPAFVADALAWDQHRRTTLASALIVDAVFGTGLLHPVRGWIADIFTELNRDYRGPIVAVDIPSGLSADAEGPAESHDSVVLRADATVAFAAPKLGHFLSWQSSAVGKLSVAPIGIPDDVLNRSGCGVGLTTAEDCRPYLAPRTRQAHKGSFGHVLVVAGSQGKSGAAALAATAALRIGAGLVTAAVPRSIQPLVAAARPELMTEALPENRIGAFTHAGLEPRLFQTLLRPATVVAMGCGVGSSKEAFEFVRFLLTTINVPCVLDADGLNAYAGRRQELKFRAGGILTPHPGEMARLFSVDTTEVESRRRYYAQRLAAETGAVALLKGHFTLIADPDGALFVNPTGNPGMASAGVGDALTGVIAGLVAQFPRRSKLETTAVAAFLHGQAGDRAAALKGEMGMMAGDLIDALPETLLALSKP